MACNCGGQTAGGNTRHPRGNQAGGSVAPEPVQSKPPVTRTRAQFILTTSDRVERVFGSRLEAQAALIRAGGKGTIRPA